MIHRDRGCSGKNIYAGKIAELLQRSAPRPNLMLGSPVHQILKDVLQYITRLNLTDPASAFFTLPPARPCMT